MSAKFQPARGTKDILPLEYSIFQQVVSAARQLAASYGFAEMTPPIFEFVEVFQRSLGETSDVVSKEMYHFQASEREHVALRPEFTAGIVRAMVSNGLQNQLPLKWFSTGPVFRRERPQRGRYRQFHQLNIEYLGAASPYADVEVIALAYDLLKALGVAHDVTVHVNSLGDAETRARYRDALVAYFSKHRDTLSADSLVRLEKNPLRILDSKDEGDRALLAEAPNLTDYYTDEAKQFFDTVMQALASLAIPAIHTPTLVRGLDYYCHTAFEFITTQLGAQGTVLGGGRYDGLSEALGGPAIPGIGFAAGIERLMELTTLQAITPRPQVVIAVGEQHMPAAMLLCQTLRQQGLAIELALDTALNKAMKWANKRHALSVIMLGDDEAISQKLQVKMMDSGEEQALAASEINAWLQTRIGR